MSEFTLKEYTFVDGTRGYGVWEDDYLWGYIQYDEIRGKWTVGDSVYETLSEAQEHFEKFPVIMERV